MLKAVPNDTPRLLDEYSLAAAPIALYFDTTLLATATGFFWRFDGKAYLITNWHNVTGKNPETMKHLDEEKGGEPNRLIAEVQVNHPEFLGNRVPLQIVLRDKDGTPLWYVHPKYGKKVDVVAVPVDPPHQYDVRPINEMPTKAMVARVGMDVFILGYPLGMPDHPAYSTPIWKRGSIASEPEMEGESRPILVDTATRRGMSGSPVIQRSFGPYHDGKTVQLTGFGASRVLGIYSGRVYSKDQFEAQLGRVWRISLVEQIIAGQCVDGA